MDLQLQREARRHRRRPLHRGPQRLIPRPVPLLGAHGQAGADAVVSGQVQLLTPSASISYRWVEQAMTYVSYSEGFKGGGWNSHFNSVLTPAQQAALQEFKPEKAKTVEVGFKLDLARRTLRLNGALCDSRYEDT